jgi:Flp pilus assembly protein TadG
MTGLRMIQSVFRCGRRLRRDRSGAVAVEFALVAMPVFMCIFAIFELGIMALQSVVLHGALEEGARQLRTGIVQEATDPQQAFEDAICSELIVLMSCDDVTYDVRSYSNFSGVVPAEYLLNDDGMPDDDEIAFEPGGAGGITVARVYARYGFVTPFLGDLFNDAHGSRMITYTAVVKGEPWD